MTLATKETSNIVPVNIKPNGITEEINSTTMNNSEAIAHTMQKEKKYHPQKRPGRLSGSMPFEIHTADAEFLFSGHTEKDSISVLQFGAQMTKIWDAAELDDPYADWYLLKVYDAIYSCRQELNEIILNHQQTLQASYSSDHFKPAAFASQSPVTKNLWFRTQYGYLIANIIADYDTLMRLSLTAFRLGVILDHSHEQLKNRWIKKILKVFKLPFQYELLELSRQTITEDTKLLKKAEKKMGELPHEILHKTLRAPFAPAIKPKPN